MNTQSGWARDQEGCYHTIEAVKPEQVVQMAEEILRERCAHGEIMSDPAQVRRWLSLKVGGLEHEVFGILFLDNRHRIIQYQEMFRGTVDGTSVHVREVIKEALRVNAQALVFVHNHPSGVAEPSDADRRLTHRLKDACGLVDIHVLDHFVVGGASTMSFAERGFL